MVGIAPRHLLPGAGHVLVGAACRDAEGAGAQSLGGKALHRGDVLGRRRLA
jgi:hypothetical protein